MWFAFLPFKIVNLCLESHLEVTGGGLQLREVGLEEGPLPREHREEGLATQPATRRALGGGCPPGGASPLK